MRDYTDEEFFKISEDDFHKKVLRNHYDTEICSYLLKNLGLDKGRVIIKSISKTYHRMWDVCEGADKLPCWSDVLKLIDKHYATHQTNN